MLFKKCLILAIVVIICKETGLKINIVWVGGSRPKIREQGTGTARGFGCCSYFDCARWERIILQGVAVATLLRRAIQAAACAPWVCDVPGGQSRLFKGAPLAIPPQWW